MAQNVRINPADYEKLAALADQKKVPLTEALSIAIEAYRRKVFLEEYVAAVAKLQTEQPDAAAADARETALWDTTSADGLAEESAHPSPARATVNAAPKKRSAKYVKVALKKRGGLDVRYERATSLRETTKKKPKPERPKAMTGTGAK